MDIYVNRPKFEEMKSKESGSSIAEFGKSRGAVMLNNEMYIITGFTSGGRVKEIHTLWAIKAVDIKDYKGDIKPLTYHEHHDDRYAGNREVGYNGMLIKSDGKDVVLVGETVFFHPKESEIQMQLIF